MVAQGRHRVMHNVLEAIPDGWKNLEDERQWMLRDASYNYTSVVNRNAKFAPGTAVMVFEPMLTEGFWAGRDGGQTEECQWCRRC